mmetsp:Transcript_11944/g.48117  ORF Transcript_11944/g.48117 Transcript_11944/m.48117 type:complete len:415 (+) Transcript_11944:862-2106(+)
MHRAGATSCEPLHNGDLRKVSPFHARTVCQARRWRAEVAVVGLALPAADLEPVENVAGDTVLGLAAEEVEAVAQRDCTVPRQAGGRVARLRRGVLDHPLARLDVHHHHRRCRARLALPRAAREDDRAAVASARRARHAQVLRQLHRRNRTLRAVDYLHACTILGYHLAAEERLAGADAADDGSLALAQWKACCHGPALEVVEGHLSPAISSDVELCHGAAGEPVVELPAHHEQVPVVVPRVVICTPLHGVTLDLVPGHGGGVEDMHVGEDGVLALAAEDEQLCAHSGATVPIPVRRSGARRLGVGPREGLQVQHEELVLQRLSVRAAKHVHLAVQHSAHVVQSARRQRSLADGVPPLSVICGHGFAGAGVVEHNRVVHEQGRRLIALAGLQECAHVKVWPHWRRYRSVARYRPR